MENNIEKLIDKIEYNVKESSNQDDLFTTYHTKYSVTIKYNNVTYSLEYQCPSDIIPTKEDVLSCVLLDSRCYEECKVSDSDIDNLAEFQALFGYEDIKDLCEAYKGCKNVYNHISKMFTKEEQESLYNYLEEKD